MFEQFSPEARRVIVRVQAEARALGHHWIGTEHLLLAIMGQASAPGVAALHDLGITHDSCCSVVEEIIGPVAGLGSRDSEALRTVGIDLDEVRRRVEETFGPGAFDQPLCPPRRSRRWRWVQRRRERCAPSGHIPFRPRAKRALERSLREALDLGDRHIGVAHLLLGLLDPKGNLADAVLDRLGARPELLRANVLADLGRAA